MRKWRLSHKLSPAQKIKDIARSYANTYLRRGMILREPCKICSSVKVEMHHPDYTKPLLIMWLCRRCHLELHKKAGIGG